MARKTANLVNRYSGKCASKLLDACGERVPAGGGVYLKGAVPCKSCACDTFAHESTLAWRNRLVMWAGVQYPALNWKRGSFRWGNADGC